MRHPGVIDDHRSRRVTALRAPLGVLVLAWGMSPAAWSNQPIWRSDEEHAADRDAVFRGVVRGKELVGPTGPETGGEQWRAEVEILEVHKPHPLVGSTRRVTVVFEQPSDRSQPGWASSRCPPYVAIETGRAYTFFARVREVEGGHPFLELPSGGDVYLRRFGDGAGGRPPRGHLPAASW